MSGKSKGNSSRSLLEAAGLVAVFATRRVLQLGWRRVTGKEPPTGPDDLEVPLSQTVVWTLVLGALATTARRFAIRYATHLLSRRQRQSLQAPAVPGQSEGPADVTT